MLLIEQSIKGIKSIINVTLIRLVQKKSDQNVTLALYLEFTEVIKVTRVLLGLD
jgi:hypothetical protein